MSKKKATKPIIAEPVKPGAFLPSQHEQDRLRSIRENAIKYTKQMKEISLMEKFANMDTSVKH